MADLESNYDVAVVDVGMAEMSGLELCGRLLAVRPDLLVIINTGHVDVDTAVAALRVGAHDFLTKPVNPRVLALRVAHAIRHRELTREIKRLRQEAPVGAPAGMVGSGSAMRRVYDLVARVAESDASVLLQGETGTGKELIARAIHAASHAKEGPFVAINCAAVPNALIESELFGHAKGAFTDAKLQRVGLLRQAEGGTVFLDEIGELPLDMQPKLLRALQERCVRPVGSDQEIPFNARVLSATNRNLEDEVEDKRFREDLYYRIAVVKIDLPRLRDRGGDVVELASHCLQSIERRTGKPAPRLSPAVAEKLMAYHWPGNVRELEHRRARRGAHPPRPHHRRRPPRARPRLPGRPLRRLGRRDLRAGQGRGGRAPLHHPRPLADGRQQDPHRRGAGHRPPHPLPQARALGHRPAPRAGLSVAHCAAALAPGAAARASSTSP